MAASYVYRLSQWSLRLAAGKRFACYSRLFSWEIAGASCLPSILTSHNLTVPSSDQPLQGAGNSVMWLSQGIESSKLLPLQQPILPVQESTHTQVGDLQKHSRHTSSKGGGGELFMLEVHLFRCKCAKRPPIAILLKTGT